MKKKEIICPPWFFSNNVVSSTSNLLCKYLHSTFASLATASALSSSPILRLGNLTVLDQHKTTRHDTGNYNQPSGVTSEVSFSQKHESLIEKYRFSCTYSDAQQFHSEIIKNGYANDLFTANTLINCYARNADLVSANKLFDEMPDKNLVTWACLISGCSHNDMPGHAITLFGRMLCEGFIPNQYAIGSVLRACQMLGAHGSRYGMQIHGLVSKTRYSVDVVVCNVLISMYGSCFMGSVGSEHARRVFDGIDNKNPVSWNSIISVYSQRDAKLAVFLFSGMQVVGVGHSFRPSEYTFASLITAAAECPCVDHGLLLLKQLLAKIEMSGFVRDLYVGSALVNLFARFGLIETATSIFQYMGTRNAVSLNGLMVGLVKLKNGEEAVELFMETKDIVTLNFDTYTVLLSAFGEFSCLQDAKRKGKEVHAYMTRTGICDARIAVGNSLINMYAKCGSIEDASTVFRFMLNKDSVSWSSMISGLDQNDYFEDAVSSFRTMRREGLMPSNFTLISALSSCGSLGWISMGEQIHSEGVKLGLSCDVSVSNSLLSLYADTGRITECRKVFFLMPAHDNVSWNSVIRAFSDSETSAIEAIKYFIEMNRAGESLNNITFINILAATTSLSRVELAHQIHSRMLKYNLMSDSAVQNALLACYGKCGEMHVCETIFARMSERNDVSWNSIISGYIHNDRLVEAMDAVWLMLHNGQRLDCYTFATVLSACASVATLEHGMEVHACSTRACLDSDVVISSAMIDMYAKCGRVEYASRIFNLMPYRNIYSWNSMISSYARHGDGHKALEIFSAMKLENQQPDHVTFIGVLSACSHVGLVSQGYEHFESMSKVYSLTPRIEHFSCMVDLLSRAGEFDKLEDFMAQIPVTPNALIWRTVLGACSRASGRMMDLGKRAVQMIIELEPRNAVNYVLIANMYASCGEWVHVTEARHAMRNAEARKEAGCSWVTMKASVHVFVSGDKSHPDTESIYKKLADLHLKMREMGYVPETRFALYDLEMENKEEVLSYHSERLAVAFVLTRKSELPIRIMKNLRVCGDCHSAFKYISEIVGRQIVLRDSNRFHHFSEGKCSCNDYW